ncbi:MAG: hypothetical protein ABIV63_11260 [Caldimonas sp.]
MKIKSFAAALMVSLLVACASQTGGVSSPSAPDDGTPPKATLVSEQRRLAELFRGTPVVFAMQSDGTLKVTVPLGFSFDKGRYAVKPPLAKVLDLVARSQRNEPTRMMVTAPADPQSKGLILATERATSTRDYLVAKGISPTRFSISAASTGDTVAVVIANR